MVRNVFLIFIHDKLSINEVRIKVTQANVHTMQVVYLEYGVTSNLMLGEID